MNAYADRKTQLLSDLAAASATDGPAIGLGKATSNLFRDRELRRPPKVNLKHFNHVLDVESRGLQAHHHVFDAEKAEVD